MEMNIGDVFTFDNDEYIVLERLIYDNKNYLFVNKVIGEETTQEYYIYELFENDEIEIVLDDNLRKFLLVKFEEMLKNDMKSIINSQGE